MPAFNNLSGAAQDVNAAMAYADVPGIIHVVALKIVIGGNVFSHFDAFQLQQHTSGHHQFQLSLPYDALAAAQDHTMSDARDLLGKRISVTFSYKNILNAGPEREFIGIISGVGFNQAHGNRGSIVLTGSSPTALLDAALHTQSFGGAQPVSLATIANEVIKQGLGETKFDVAVKPAYTSNLLYSCQYQESHYNYLARMAAAYGEWFYYDGRVLNFGKPALPAPVSLIYGKDTTQVQMQMHAVYANQRHYGYNSHTNQPLSAGDTPASGLGELGDYAHSTSQKIFAAPSLRVAPMRAASDNDIEAAQASDTGGKAARAFTVTGVTTVPFLYPGCVIDLNMRKPGSTDASYFSKLLVVSVSHSVDTLGHYQGFFEAIPAETTHLPAAAFRNPVAEPQLATVKDNKDDAGRIRVQFDWQQGGETTDFIRMMSPDAGNSDKVSVNRGFMAIPELNDQVMIGFVHSHPDRPFVMGAMYTGITGRGGGTQNHIKSISTRSGCLIRFDDTDGEGSIYVQDPSGNSWYMDGKGNIAVNAPKNFTLNAGENIIMAAGKDVSVSAGVNITNSANTNITSIAGKDIIQTAAGDIQETSDTRTELVEKEYSRGAQMSDVFAEQITLTSASEDMLMQSKKSVHINSGEKNSFF